MYRCNIVRTSSSSYLLKQGHGEGSVGIQAGELLNPKYLLLLFPGTHDADQVLNGPKVCSAQGQYCFAWSFLTHIHVKDLLPWSIPLLVEGAVACVLYVFSTCVSVLRLLHSFTTMSICARYEVDGKASHARADPLPCSREEGLRWGNLHLDDRKLWWQCQNMDQCHQSEG